MNISKQTLHMLAQWMEAYDFEAQLLSALCKTCSFNASAATEEVLLAAMRAHKCKLKKKIETNT